MLVFGLSALFWATIGAFGTAYIHEKKGRDVTMGALLGAAVGFIGQFFLVGFWVWLWYSSPAPVGRRYGPVNRPWYRWWDF